jgi:hypothetical protein
MKRYELIYAIDETGVFCVGHVATPAVGATLVMFGDESNLIEFQDDEKQIVYSVAMRPNINIPRKNINGEPAMVFYSEKTVEDLQQNFFKKSAHIGTTVNHDKNVRKDVYAFESWIVQDPEKDKATILGMAVEKGDWVLGQKVDNPEVWQKIKNRELQGFSIEAYLEPILTNTNVEMTKEEVDARIKQVLMESEEEKALKAKEEEDAKKLEMAEPGTEPTAEEPKPDLEKRVAELEAENNDLKAKLAEYELKETEMSNQLTEMKSEIEKGLKPATDAPKKKYEEMSNAEKAKFNRGKL